MNAHYMLTSIVVLSLLTASSAAAHPFHVSIAEAEWNAATGSLEVALRVNPVDLEQALRQRNSRPIDLDKTPGIDKMIRAYVEAAFVVKSADGASGKLKWIGMEASVKEAWLYFEIPLKGGIVGATCANAIFFELLNDQSNTINFRSEKNRKSLTMTADRPEQTLRF